MRAILILFVMILLAGCTQERQLTGLTVDVSYQREVYYGKDFTVNVRVENNFKKEVKNIFIEFKNIDILNFKKIEKCERGKIVGYGCKIDMLEPGDESEIVFLFNMPKEIDILGGQETVKPELRVSYDFSGQTIVYIPIFGEKYKNDIPIKTTQSEGPIKVNVDVPVQSSVKSGDIIPIEVSIYGSDEDNVIKKDDFSIRLTNLQVYTGDGETNCDFRIISETTLGLEDDFSLKGNKKLGCLLRASNVESYKFDYGMILIDYRYNYKIVNFLEIMPTRKLGR